MNLKFMDVDTREIIDVIDDPSLMIYQVCRALCDKPGATVVRITQAESDNEWIIELKIPMEVRQRQIPQAG